MVYTFILLGKGRDYNDNVSFSGSIRGGVWGSGGTDPNQTQENKARSRCKSSEKGKRKDPDTQ